MTAMQQCLYNNTSNPMVVYSYPCHMSRHQLLLVHCAAPRGEEGKNDVTAGGLCALSPGPTHFECDLKKVFHEES